MVSICVRPSEGKDCFMPGHLESNPVKGAFSKSSVAVLVERVARAILLRQDADEAVFTTKLRSLVELQR
ncbi:MAG: hypothetical protein E5299_01293 [Burkholderia gladioli]|nr:MAG: hypothetical protein E5299_01293 [Burkholderia gladioli]